jgi:hypothetical protein
MGTATEVMSAKIEFSGDTPQLSTPELLFVAPVTNGVQWDVSRDGQRILIAGPLDRGNDTPITGRAELGSFPKEVRACCVETTPAPNLFRKQASKLKISC